MPDRASNPVIPLNKPEILDEDIDLVAETLRRGTLSMGSRLLEFEQLVAERTRRPFGIGVASGAMPRVPGPLVPLPNTMPAVA
jgi:dTDP-4-amino-4,6-dideoxygalactose transaminase